MPSGMRRFVASVVVVSCLTVGWVVVAYPTERWQGLLVLVALGLVAANMTFDYPTSASVSLGFAFTFAAIVYAGPMGGALVGLAGAASVQEIRDRRPWLLIVGNGAQLALAGAVSGVLYTELCGISYWRLPTTAVEQVIAPTVAVTGFFFVNVALVSIGVGLRTGMKPSEALRGLGLAHHWVSLLVLALLGLMLAELLTRGSWMGAMFLVLPFAAARRTFRVYAELSEAYTTTVRSLMAAIEAKDPYTKGHSERVAAYARRVGEALSLPRSDLDLLERSALLHDVGKIGIGLETLVSPERLTDDQIQAIKSHPSLGAELVAEVEFLHDTVHVIRCHHEHFDGGGYPDGLAGEQIPMLSRLLSVADAYDAMTSDRAYRPGMSVADALDELCRVSGTQLDPHLVAAFTETIGPEPYSAVTT